MNEPEFIGSGNDQDYEAEFQELFGKVGEVLRDHMRRGEVGGFRKDLVFQVLNVMAAHTAVVLAGCNDHEADRFFHACLNGTLQTAREEAAQGEIAKQHTSG
jgi:hypothetical protein